MLENKNIFAVSVGLLWPKTSVPNISQKRKGGKNERDINREGLFWVHDTSVHLPEQLLETTAPPPLSISTRCSIITKMHYFVQSYCTCSTNLPDSLALGFSPTWCLNDNPEAAAVCRSALSAPDQTEAVLWLGHGAVTTQGEQVLYVQN